MPEQPAPRPLDAGATVSGALDHAWVVERMDQQYGLGQETRSTWIARVRCVHCGLRVDFRAADVPPCRPQEAASSP